MSETFDRKNPVLDAFITGLQNAHAVEMQALETIEGQLKRHEHYADLIEALKRHRDATETMAGRLEMMLHDLGEKTSPAKDGILAFIGKVAVTAHAPTEDEAIKNTFAGFAFKHYEIAMYESLLVMAERAGITERDHLRQNLTDVELLAGELRPLLGSVTKRYLDLEIAEKA